MLYGVVRMIFEGECQQELTKTSKTWMIMIYHEPFISFLHQCLVFPGATWPSQREKAAATPLPMTPSIDRTAWRGLWPRTHRREPTDLPHTEATIALPASPSLGQA